MEIKWQWNERVFCLRIGFCTKWFAQFRPASLIEEYYDGPSDKPTYAKFIWESV